jgi:ABC-type Na+ transport system ATPase subunit NatA
MIVVQELRKDFRSLTAVYDMSFTVGDGEISPACSGRTAPARRRPSGCWPG